MVLCGAAQQTVHVPHPQAHQGLQVRRAPSHRRSHKLNLWLPHKCWVLPSAQGDAGSVWSPPTRGLQNPQARVGNTAFSFVFIKTDFIVNDVYWCRCVHVRAGAHPCWKRISNPLELDTGNPARALKRTVHTLSHTGFSL